MGSLRDRHVREAPVEDQALLRVFVGAAPDGRAVERSVDAVGLVKSAISEHLAVEQMRR
jgi:hypothetical protein